MPLISYKPRATMFRHWSDEQKLRILQEYAAAKKSGIRGAMQRVCDHYTITNRWVYLWAKQMSTRGLWDVETSKVVKK